MDARETCRFFSIGKTTLYDWTSRGLIQSVKVRGTRRWLRRSVHECAERHLNQVRVAEIGGAS
jgi:predicted site-specific integrase-resolvase